MSDSDSFWLMIWELVAAIGIIGVIVGILGEGSELLVKWAIKPKYKQFQKNLDVGFRWFLAVLMKYIRPKILEVETFAFALVVLGLVAEFWGGHKSTQILDKNNSKLNLEARQLGITNAQLVADNLVLRSNVAALELKVQWRTITATQESQIIDLLRPFMAANILLQKKIIIKEIGGDPESVRYVNRISDVLKACGLNPGVEMDVAVPDLYHPGLFLIVNSSAPPPLFAQEIAKSFKAAKIDFEYISNDVPSSGTLLILVNPKKPL